MTLRDELLELHAQLEVRGCGCADALWALLEADARPKGHFIFDGIPIPVACEVKTWHDHGLTFDLEHAPPRTEPIRAGVVHWTGGGKRVGIEGAATVHRTLQARGLSVEMAILDDSVAYQYVDPARQRCRHASRINPFAFGIEVSGPGWIRRWWERVLRRRTYKARIHGWNTTWLDFLPGQQATLNALADGFASAGIIPASVTTEPWERRSNRFFATQQGWCGHLHCAHLNAKHPKCDPASAPLLALEAHFQEGRQIQKT